MLSETKCLDCGAEMKRRVEDVPFDAALPGIVLAGLAVHRCPDCGYYEVEIPHLEELHRTIAAHLIGQTRRLAGAEVRFLRKWLGWSGQDFARHIGVSPETVSRWENEREPIGGTSDRLLRLIVVVRRPVADYPLDHLAEIGDVATPPAVVRFAPTKRGWKTAA